MGIKEIDPEILFKEKKDNKFTFLHSIFSIMKKISQRQHNYRLLSQGLYKLYFLKTNNDSSYKQSPKEKKLWNNHIDKLLKLGRLDEVDYYLSHGMKFDFGSNFLRYMGSYIHTWSYEEDFFQNQFLNKNVEEIQFKKHNNLYNHVRKYLLNLDDTDEFVKDWKENLLSNINMFSKSYDALSVLDHYKYVHDLYNESASMLLILKSDLSSHITPEEAQTYLIAFYKAEQHIDNAYDRFSELIELPAKKHIFAIKDFLLEVMNNDMKINEKPKVLDNKVFISEELPAHAIDILNAIKEKYPFVCSEYELSQLVEVKIPLIIAQYLDIDKNYRDKVKNAQEQNATEVLIEALKNIENALEEKFADIQQEKLHSLNAMKRYTKRV